MSSGSFNPARRPVLRQKKLSQFCFCFLTTVLIEHFKVFEENSFYNDVLVFTFVGKVLLMPGDFKEYILKSISTGLEENTFS